jgi:TPR repeat protein
VLKDDSKAAELFTLVAKQGSTRAQLDLGYRYSLGLGVAVDKGKAAEWYTLAAERGNADARCALRGGAPERRHVYAQGYTAAPRPEHRKGFAADQKGETDDTQAIIIYELREDGGRDDLYGLGCRWREGPVIDLKKAADFFLRSAEQGQVHAQFEIAECYRLGRGVEKDDKKAVEWYTKAAEQGDGDAQFRLGMCYFNGDGVAKDEKKAVECFTKVAEHQPWWSWKLNLRDEARSQLAYSYENGRGVARDPEKAAYWRSAEQRHARWHFDIGECHRLGRGKEKDDKKAVEWYTNAAGQGDGDAQFRLGMCYFNGDGVAKDEKKAVECFTKAAEHPQWWHLKEEARSQLAFCYENGRGVARDPEKAAYWRSRLPSAQKSK